MAKARTTGVSGICLAAGAGASKTNTTQVATMKTGMIRARIDPALKGQAETILKSVGLNPSDAIRLFYTQITLSDGLPFAVKVPDAKSREAMRDADAGKATCDSDAAGVIKKMGELARMSGPRGEGESE